MLQIILIMQKYENNISNMLLHTGLNNCHTLSYFSNYLALLY